MTGTSCGVTVRVFGPLRSDSDTRQAFAPAAFKFHSLRAILSYDCEPHSGNRPRLEVEVISM